ncbi:MAG: hypothetical protein QS748_09285 [Candidatus Endonucleobacter bathymodioli]|uniref:Uncharacterized protein n=1 Tax=Candidatus Endonucleibacter bathymodioli TaxID=539814 RepID=A0AA90NZH4_9GAMM|nr:hypothetical protein [Candidatus Endonucleobacter bathymodioli]
MQSVPFLVFKCDMCKFRSKDGDSERWVAINEKNQYFASRGLVIIFWLAFSASQMSSKKSNSMYYLCGLRAV